MKPWMSEATWSVVKWIAPVRRASFAFGAMARKRERGTVFWSWAAAVHAPFLADSESQQLLGWAAAGKSEDARRAWAVCPRLLSKWSYQHGVTHIFPYIFRYYQLSPGILPYVHLEIPIYILVHYHKCLKIPEWNPIWVLIYFQMSTGIPVMLP